MLTLLCDTCAQPISGDGFELTLLPGTLVSGDDSKFRRFTSVTARVISAILCVPCGERFNAILHHKLSMPDLRGRAGSRGGRPLELTTAPAQGRARGLAGRAASNRYHQSRSLTASSISS